MCIRDSVVIVHDENASAHAITASAAAIVFFVLLLFIFGFSFVLFMEKNSIWFFDFTTPTALCQTLK